MLQMWSDKTMVKCQMPLNALVFVEDEDVTAFIPTYYAPNVNKIR